jgi:hypothetical protein
MFSRCPPMRPFLPARRQESLHFSTPDPAPAAGATLTVITGCAAAAFSVRYPVDQ